MRIAAATLMLLSLSLALTGCGFTPLYATPSDSAASAGVMESFSRIAIRPLPDRQGMKLRQELRERLQPQGTKGAPLYDLDVTLTRQVVELGIRPDATASRANLIISASFYLTEGGKRVFGDNTQSVVGYNLLDDQFATVAAQADAENRAIRQVSDDIKIRLAVYFERRAKSVAAAAP